MARKKKENTYITYFAIKGDFVVEEIESLIGLEPFRKWNKTDIRKADNKPFGFSCYCVSRIEDSFPYVDSLMERTLFPLMDKIDLLNEIKEKYNVEYHLVVVPHVIVNNINPCLAPSMEVMEFCVKTKTKLDIDLYLYK